MPVIKCESNGKYRIGQGACIYDTKEDADKIWKALLAKGIYQEESYTDYPEGAVNNAKRALEYADKNGWGNCGTPVGKARANQLANKEPISRDTIARMSAFARHLQYEKVPYDKGCGGLMVDSWGGRVGIEWAQRKLKEIDNV